jgi:hypothetical protein
MRDAKNTKMSNAILDYCNGVQTPAIQHPLACTSASNNATRSSRSIRLIFRRHDSFVPGHAIIVVEHAARMKLEPSR